MIAPATGLLQNNHYVSYSLIHSFFFQIAKEGYGNSFQITGHHSVAISELPLESTGIIYFDFEVGISLKW